jgi:hypothetical protein
MRYLLAVNGVPLSDNMEVTVIAGAKLDSFYVKWDDPEYRLLAAAIDRFVTVMKAVQTIEAQAKLLEKEIK